MNYAIQSLDDLLPVSATRLDSLDEERIQDLDQFVYRFGKLQDAIGLRLLPALLAYLQEPFEDRPMRDKLDRLETLGYLQSADRWQELRELRNAFAHDYPDDSERKAALINKGIAAAQELEQLLMGVGRGAGLAP